MVPSSSPPPTTQTQIHDYLLTIALPLLPIVSFTAPPFPGRGIFFAALISTTYYMKLASPWSANEGSACTQSRYGTASSWLLLLPVLERLLLHVPERDFWRVDNINYKSESNGKHDDGIKLFPSSSSSPTPTPPPWTWRKVCWATALASSPRAVGWNIASRRVSTACEEIARQGIGRWAFLCACLWRAVCAFLALDAVLVFGHDLRVPTAWVWEWETLRDILAAEGLMLVCTYASMTLQFEVLAAASVGLGLSKPEVRIIFNLDKSQLLFAADQ